MPNKSFIFSLLSDHSEIAVFYAKILKTCFKLNETSYLIDKFSSSSSLQLLIHRDTKLQLHHKPRCTQSLSLRKGRVTFLRDSLFWRFLDLPSRWDARTYLRVLLLFALRLLAIFVEPKFLRRFRSHLTRSLCKVIKSKLGRSVLEHPKNPENIEN